MSQRRQPDEQNENAGQSGSGAATGIAITNATYNTAAEYGQRIADGALQAKEYVSGKATEDLGQVVNEIKDYTRQKPVGALLLSALGGLALGLLLPRRLRKQTLPAQVRVSTGEARADISSSAAESGSKEVAKPYVISMPTGFHKASVRYSEKLAALHESRAVNVLDDIGDDADKLALLTDRELSQLKAKLPGLVIEPNILYKKYRHPLLEGFQELSVMASANSKTVTIFAIDEETHAPLKNVTIYLLLDETRRRGFRGITGADGTCRFTTRSSTRKFDALMALPQYSYWNRRLTNVKINGVYEIELQPLASNRTALYDWGHQFAEMKDDLQADGSGVKIGIIDSGIRRDHPGLKPSGGYNCVFGEDRSLWYEDDDGHGTHCAGVVAATLVQDRGVKGYAAKAEIRSYRVFGKNSEGAATFDIVKAIARAVEDGCDIISMSFGSNVPQSAIRTRTEYAYDRGVLCIAATGNEASSVAFPAAFPSVIGVGAFGKFKSYPDDSLHKATESALVSADGQYYCANFSNFGENMEFCAPGVAILSTVPGGDYCAWDGTSMACPQVAGMAALALGAHPEVLNAARDAERVERLIKILKSSSRRLGFGGEYEGSGCLTVPPLLVA